MEQNGGWIPAKVQCNLCSHQWIAVYPAECNRLECPKCEQLSIFNVTEYLKRSHPFKISKNWHSVITLEQLIEGSKFCFSHTGHNGESPYIVLKDNLLLDGFDTIQIGYDRWGLTTDSVTNFNTTWGGIIKDSSKNIVEFIKDFLIRDGASDLIYK